MYSHFISLHYGQVSIPWYRLNQTVIMAIKTLNFITGNKNKLAEVRAILQGVVEVESQAIDTPEIQGTIEEIAKEKCRRAAEVVRSKCHYD